MAEENEIELSEEVRRYIKDVAARLEQLTFYELLGVSPTADMKTIKRAYFRLATLVHPDRYFGKNLGSYRPKLDAVFNKIHKAYQVLASKERREDYDAYLKEQAEEGKAPAPAANAPVDPRIAAKRKAAQELLLQHQTQARAKALRFIEDAKRALAAGDLVAAATAYQSALTFSPEDEELKKAYAQVHQLAAGKLADSHARKAQMEERFGRWAEAVQSWQRVLAERPNDAQAQQRLAAALARVQGR
jgi:curved DNA-binding protein CbpA